MKRSDFNLREWKMSDKNSLVHYANNKKIYDNLRDAFPFPYRDEDAESFIHMAINAGPDLLLMAIDYNGEAVGSIGAFMQKDVYRKNAEIGYWLGEPYWGKGIMTDAIRKIVAHVFSEYDILRIYAEPYAFNMGSRRALEKAGFRCEGLLEKNVYKNNKLIDSCIYSILNMEKLQQ